MIDAGAVLRQQQRQAPCRSSARVAQLAGHCTASAAPTPVPGLLPEQRQEFLDRGFVVMRGLLSPTEVDQLAGPVFSAYKNHEYEASAAYDRPDLPGGGLQEGQGYDGATNQEAYLYPKPGNFPLGSRILESKPELLDASANHPRIIAAVEDLLGDQAVLSQYQIYMRTPGAKGTGNSTEKTPGEGTHYDYKPWRPVGSFLNW
jgi:hypothetical protein